MQVILPRVPISLWKQVFVEAGAVHRMQPWKKAYPTEVFGVHILETSEIHFVSISDIFEKGFSGPVIQSFKGHEGYHFISELLEVGMDRANKKMKSYIPDGIRIEYGTADRLTAQELRASQVVGVKPASPDAWFTCRSFKGKYLTWSVNIKDMHAIIGILKAIPVFLKMQESEPGWSQMDGGAVPLFTYSTMDQSVEFDFVTLNEVQEFANKNKYGSIYDSLGTELEKKILNYPFKVGHTWELYSFFANQLVKKDEKAYFPEMLYLFCIDSGRILAHKKLFPNDDSIEAITEMVVNSICQEEKIPQIIRYADPDHLQILERFSLITQTVFQWTEPTAGVEFEKFHDENIGEAVKRAKGIHINS